MGSSTLAGDEIRAGAGEREPMTWKPGLSHGFPEDGRTAHAVWPGDDARRIARERA